MDNESNESLVLRIQARTAAGEDTKGDIAALYEQNQGMITLICRKYAHMGEELEDLRQMAFIGLYEAARHYDGTKGVLFMTYALYMIESVIRRSINAGKLVKRPPYIDNLLYRYNRFITAYTATHDGEQPTDEEIREHLGLSPEQYEDLRKYRHCDDIDSLDAPLNDDMGEHSMLDYLESEDNTQTALDGVYQEELRADVARIMEQTLTPSEQDIIRARYWYAQTLGHIALQKNVTRERVRQVLANSYRKMTRKPQNRKILESYAGIEARRYRGTFTRFKQTGTSIVEWEILRHEEILEDELQRTIAKYKRQREEQEERHRRRMEEYRRNKAM